MVDVGPYRDLTPVATENPYNKLVAAAAVESAAPEGRLEVYGKGTR